MAKLGSVVASKFQYLASILVPLAAREFPKIDKSVLSEFDSWDPTLGWRNPPNIKKPEKTGEFKPKQEAGAAHHQASGSSTPFFSSDSTGSRITSRPDLALEIAVFGDSFAMCREVGDTQTWPYRLGEIRNSKVSNHGVGNYGLDQALLLMEKQLREERNSPAYVILGVTTATAARCASVYRHYYETGNVLAVKPRFIESKHGSLKLVPYPLESKADLLQLKTMRSHLKQFDEHRRHWLAARRNYYFLRLPALLAQKLGIRASLATTKPYDYELRFWVSHRNLFVALARRFAQIADREGVVPIFLLQHQRASLTLARSGESLPWAAAIDEAKRECAEIVWLDETEAFEGVRDVDELYTGAHHSAAANSLVAEYVSEKLERLGLPKPSRHGELCT